MLSCPPGTFVPLAIATHGLVGLALGAVLFDRPLVGLAAGLAPVIAVAAVLSDRRTLGAAGAAYGSHLLIDSTTPTGIPLVYPLLDDRLYLDVGIGGHAPVITLALWLCCLGAVGYWFRSR